MTDSLIEPFTDQLLYRLINKHSNDCTAAEESREEGHMYALAAHMNSTIKYYQVLHKDRVCMQCVTYKSTELKQGR